MIIKRLLTTSEAGALLGVTRERVVQLILGGHLKADRVSARLWLVPRAQVGVYLKRRERKRVKAAINAKKRRRTQRRIRNARSKAGISVRFSPTGLAGRDGETLLLGPDHI